MSLNEVTKKLIQYREELENFGVRKISIFGSVVHHEETPDSDIDILVDFDPAKGIFVFIDLKFFLEKILEKPVDLVSRKGLHPALKEQIMREAKDAF